jgi:hypothetical protein
MVMNTGSYTVTGSIRPNGAMFSDGVNFISAYITWLQIMKGLLRMLKETGVAYFNLLS